MMLMSDEEARPVGSAVKQMGRGVEQFQHHMVAALGPALQALGGQVTGLAQAAETGIEAFRQRAEQVFDEFEDGMRQSRQEREQQ